MKRLLFTLLILFTVGTCYAQTKLDSLILQQKTAQFQIALNEVNRIEIELKEQKVKAFDAWAEYSKALTPFQQTVQPEEKKKPK